MATAWAPKLGKAKEVNGEQGEDASDAQEASPLSARPFPTLADLRSQVDQQLQEACALRSSWEVSTENSRLSNDLRAARSLLEEGEIEAAWQEEVEFWKEEVSRLEAEVLALKQRRAEASEVKLPKTNVEKDSREKMEVVALSRAERQLAELESEQASCEAAAEKAERANAKLRYTLKQNSGLERGGAARLFVSALPALDASAVEAARTALHAHMQKLKLNGQKG